MTEVLKIKIALSNKSIKAIEANGYTFVGGWNSKNQRVCARKENKLYSASNAIELSKSLNIKP